MKSQNNVFQRAMLLKLVRLQKYKQQDGGFILVVVIAMTLILTSLFAVYGLLSKTETSSTTASVRSNSGFYAAEAGLNLRAKQVLDKFVGYNRPEGTSPGSLENCINNTGNQGTLDFACSSQTFNGQNLFSYVIENANNPNFITIGPGEPFAGLSAQEYRYDVNSVAVNSQNLPTAILEMRFKSRLVPMFQFLAFYNKDLEITDPPNMNLSGRIHANGNIYLNAFSPNSLRLNSQISAMGTLYSGKKFNTECNGFVYINDPSTARQLGCSGTTRTAYPNANLTAWNQRIVTRTDRLIVPQAESFDPTSGATYWDKADLRVVLNVNAAGDPLGIQVRNQNDPSNSTTTTATTATNNLINTCVSLPNFPLRNEADGTSSYETTDTALIVASTAGLAVGDLVTIGTDYDNNTIATPTSTRITLSRPLGTAQSAGTMVRKAIASTSNTFFNNREKRVIPLNPITTGTAIRMLEIDVQSLLNCVQAHKKGLDDDPNLSVKGLDDTTDGGLVWYLTVLGPNSNTINNYGVRVRNGSQLSSTVVGALAVAGLTIISDQAVYIKGDYNSTNKKPAAVLADTINVLSNNWNMGDSTSTGTVSSRTATPTTINAAFLAGTDITGGAEGSAGQDKAGGVATFNGGLNNYPRLHESWTSIRLNYRGSFVSLGLPRKVNGGFCGPGEICRIYNPPDRNWDYDSDFNNAANLPPLTPRFVYLRQEVFSRDFER